MHFGADGLDVPPRLQNPRFHLLPLARFVVGELLFDRLRYQAGDQHARLLTAREARHRTVKLARIEEKPFGPSGHFVRWYTRIAVERAALRSVGRKSTRLLFYVPTVSGRCRIAW